MNESSLPCQIEPPGAQGVYLAFDLLYDKIPHGGSEGIFSDGDSQIVEVIPIVLNSDVENMRDAS